MQNDYRVLLDLLRRLTPSDRSILELSLNTPDSQIATVEGSPNDAFLTKLAEFGLAEEKALDLEVPAQLARFVPKSFALTDEGRTVIIALLDRA